MRYLVSILLITAVICIGAQAYAQDPASKLFRGLVNTATGFLELPITVYRVSKQDGYPTGLTLGLCKGLVNSVYRTLVGVYEVVTFPIPMPTEYKSITKPETLLTSETLVPGYPAMRTDFKPLSGELGNK